MKEFKENGTLAYKAKDIFYDQIDGSFKEQHKSIYDYAHEFLARNLRSIVKV